MPQLNRTRFPRLGGTFAAVLMAVAAGPTSAGPWAPPVVVQAQAGGANEALLAAFRDRTDPQDLRRRLVPLGGTALPLLFRIAAAGRLPAAGDTIPAPLSDAERAVVREVLAIQPRRQVVAFLEDLAATEITPPTRFEAQRLLAAIGTAENLALLARLTVPMRELGLSPGLRSGFESALEAILGRDPTGYSRLRPLVREGPPTLAGSVIDAMGHNPAEEGTAALGDVLGLAPELDPLVLLRIGDRASPGRVADEGVCDRVRRYLTHQDPTLLCAAARAAGRWRDAEAVPWLVEHLDHAELRVRLAACVALRDVTGLNFGADGRRWHAWYDAETSWWETEGNAVLARVERARGAEFVRAACELLKHRMYRRRAAESLVRALDHAEADEVRLICVVLGNLGEPLAIPALESCLQRDEPGTRLEAERALDRIQGRSGGPETSSRAEADPDEAGEE